MPRPKVRWMVGALALLVAGLTACEPPVGEPGQVSTISKISSTTEDGWRYDFYRNTSYPCSISGYQTFLIATRVGSAATETRPLWVYMHGGGVGYFSPEGDPEPSAIWKTEEGPEDLRAEFDKGELMRRIRDEPAGFRMMSVSMCNHDIYGGDDTPDPNNPNTTPDGTPRTANGLFATKAAVQHAHDLYPTDDYFLHGTSAGSYGTYSVSWGLQQQGLPPTGTVSDSGVLNPPWLDAQVDGGGCAPTDAAQAIINQRLHPDLVDPANAPDLLVARGELTAPILQVWTQGDFLGCGLRPMECPLRDGTTPTMGSVDCQNEPLRAAIADQGPGSRSLSMRLCVDRPQTPQPCDMHVPTAREELNTDPAWPADFTAPILDWVRDRQGDDGPDEPGPRADERFVIAAYDDFLDRPPTGAELDAATTQLERGSRSRRAVVGDLARSTEGVGIVVERQYQTLLGRAADPGGRAFWTDRIRTGRSSVAEVAAQLSASAEHFAGPGQGDERTWVDQLYRQLLGRPAEAAGLDHWSQRAAAGNRLGVTRALVGSLEARRLRVDALYRDLLGRAADPGGLTYWAGQIGAVGDLAVAVALASSPEYDDRA